MNAPGYDPITKLHKAMKASERIRGINMEELGPREMPHEATPPRLLLVPLGGSLKPPDHSGNLFDFAESIRCDCLGRDYSQLRELIRRLLSMVDDYTSTVGDSPADTTADGVADCIQFLGGDIEYDDDPDTNRQGRFASVTLQLLTSFESTSLDADASHGVVDSVVVEPA